MTTSSATYASTVAHVTQLKHLAEKPFEAPEDTELWDLYLFSVRTRFHARTRLLVPQGFPVNKYNPAYRRSIQEP